MPDFVERGNDIRDIDEGVKDKFQWRWLEEQDGNDDYFRLYVRKLKEPGM